MSYLPRLTHWEYQDNLQQLKREMGEEWMKNQLDVFREGMDLLKFDKAQKLIEEPNTDEDRWTVWNALEREVSLAFQERKLKEGKNA